MSKVGDIVERKWGTYEILKLGDEYSVKQLNFRPNSSISRQYHKNRDEHWVFIKGGGEMELQFQGSQKTTRYFRANSHLYIPAYCWHRFTSDNNETSVVETWYGNSTEEDIVRDE